MKKYFIEMTGSPSSFGYKTKGAFVVVANKHAEVTQTKLTQCADYLLTDSLNSITGKAQLAIKKGIPIKTYSEFLKMIENPNFARAQEYIKRLNKLHHVVLNEGTGQKECYFVKSLIEEIEENNDTALTKDEQIKCNELYKKYK